ncbi:MAG: hypothetical protein HY303_13790, partial [Candidatus Wallbacteria bacterium]|nr:hypothetical protein [Candidatus Wallbacteria bacterium]
MSSSGLVPVSGAVAVWTEAAALPPSAIYATDEALLWTVAGTGAATAVRTRLSLLGSGSAQPGMHLWSGTTVSGLGSGRLLQSTPVSPEVSLSVEVTLPVTTEPMLVTLLRDPAVSWRTIRGRVPLSLRLDTATTSVAEMTLEMMPRVPTMPLVSVHPPGPTILLQAGAVQSLVVTASDPVDGPLTGESLVWQEKTSPTTWTFVTTGAMLQVPVGNERRVLRISAINSSATSVSTQVTLVGLNSPRVSVERRPPSSWVFEGSEVSFFSTVDWGGASPDRVSYQWVSERQGSLGSTPAVTVTTLEAGLHTIGLTAGAGSFQATTACTVQVIGDAPQIVSIRAIDATGGGHDLDIGAGGERTIDRTDRSVQVLVFNPSGRSVVLAWTLSSTSTLAFSGLALYANRESTASWTSEWNPDAKGTVRVPLPAGAVYVTVEATVLGATSGKTGMQAKGASPARANSGGPGSSDGQVSMEAQLESHGVPTGKRRDFAGIRGRRPSLANPDWDGDGLSAADEIARGTNPFLADTDGDGIPDGADPRPLEARTSSGCHSEFITGPPTTTITTDLEARMFAHGLQSPQWQQIDAGATYYEATVSYSSAPEACYTQVPPGRLDPKCVPLEIQLSDRDTKGFWVSFGGDSPEVYDWKEGKAKGRAQVHLKAWRNLGPPLSLVQAVEPGPVPRSIHDGDAFDVDGPGIVLTLDARYVGCKIARLRMVDTASAGLIDGFGSEPTKGIPSGRSNLTLVPTGQTGTLTFDLEIGRKSVDTGNTETTWWTRMKRYTWQARQFPKITTIQRLLPNGRTSPVWHTGTTEAGLTSGPVFDTDRGMRVVLSGAFPTTATVPVLLLGEKPTQVATVPIAAGVDHLDLTTTTLKQLWDSIDKPSYIAICLPGTSSSTRESLANPVPLVLCELAPPPVIDVRPLSPGSAPSHIFEAEAAGVSGPITTDTGGFVLVFESAAKRSASLLASVDTTRWTSSYSVCPKPADLESQIRKGESEARFVFPDQWLPADTDALLACSWEGEQLHNRSSSSTPDTTPFAKRGQVQKDQSSSPPPNDTKVRAAAGESRGARIQVEKIKTVRSLPTEHEVTLFAANAESDPSGIVGNVFSDDKELLVSVKATGCTTASTATFALAYPVAEPARLTHYFGETAPQGWQYHRRGGEDTMETQVSLSPGQVTTIVVAMEVDGYQLGDSEKLSLITTFALGEVRSARFSEATTGGRVRFVPRPNLLRIVDGNPQVAALGTVVTTPLAVGVYHMSGTTLQLDADHLVPIPGQTVRF